MTATLPAEGFFQNQTEEEPRREGRAERATLPGSSGGRIRVGPHELVRESKVLERGTQERVEVGARSHVGLRVLDGGLGLGRLVAERHERRARVDLMGDGLQLRLDVTLDLYLTRRPADRERAAMVVIVVAVAQQDQILEVVRTAFFPRDQVMALEVAGRAAAGHAALAFVACVDGASGVCRNVARDLAVGRELIGIARGALGSRGVDRDLLAGTFL